MDVLSMIAIVGIPVWAWLAIRWLEHLLYPNGRDTKYDGLL
jgi:hypothetical protein